jgi:hypothetical protein
MAQPYRRDRDDVGFFSIFEVARQRSFFGLVCGIRPPGRQTSAIRGACVRSNGRNRSKGAKAPRVLCAQRHLTGIAAMPTPILSCRRPQSTALGALSRQRRADTATAACEFSSVVVVDMPARRSSRQSTKPIERRRGTLNHAPESVRPARPRRT